MFRIHKLSTPVAPPSNPIGKKLADVTPAGVAIKHQEFSDKVGGLPRRSTMDWFDTNGDGKADYAVGKDYDPKDPQRLTAVELMIQTPGKPHIGAGGQTFGDANADGFIDGFTIGTPGPGNVAIGETVFGDNDFDGRVDFVGSTGVNIDPAVATRFPEKVADVLFHDQRDSDGDGKLDVEQISNPFRPATW